MVEFINIPFLGSISQHPQATMAIDMGILWVAVQKWKFLQALLPSTCFSSWAGPAGHVK